MKRFLWQKSAMRGIALLLLAVLWITGVTGCNTKEAGVMTGIRFDRGHGSMWGNQFCIEVRTDEIREVRFFPGEGRDQITCAHIPITAQQWEELRAAVEALELVEDRPTLWQKLFGGQKQDGGEYRKLTLIRQDGAAEEEITYRWPASAQAQALEKLLEQLTADLTETEAP